MQDLNCQQTCKGKLLLEPYFRTSIITDHRGLQLLALMSQALSFLTQSLQLFLSAFGILLQSLVVKIVGPTGSGVGDGSGVGLGSGVGVGSGVGLGSGVGVGSGVGLGSLVGSLVGVAVYGSVTRLPHSIDEEEMDGASPFGIFLTESVNTNSLPYVIST